jgi:glucokinase
VCAGAETSLDRGRFIAGNGNVKDIADAAEKGDLLAIKEIKRYGAFLGRTIGLLVNLLNFELIVLAGGIAQSWPLFEKTVKKNIEVSCFAVQRSDLTIRIASDPEQAGVIGAAALVFYSRY